MLWRKVGNGGFVFCGGCGDKKFTDNTLPAGAANVTCQIHAVRSTAVGPWAQFTSTSARQRPARQLRRWARAT